MPKILEQEAFLLAQNIDSLKGKKKDSALDILTRYKQQQEDEGLPHFPTQEAEKQSRELEFRSMFKNPEAIKYEPASFSANPILDKQQHANMALLARAYPQKEPLEIAERYDYLLNDYASQRFSKKEIDTAEFYAEARKMIERDEQRENTSLEGAKAALRGEDVIPALQAWQAKNLDRLPDSTEYTRGFLQAREVISGVGLSDAVDAYQRTMQGSPKDGDKETLKDFEGLLLDLPGAKRKAVLTAATMMAQARGEKAVKGIGARESGPMGGAGAAINAITGFFQEIGESGGRYFGKFGGIAKDEELESMSNMPTLPLITDAAKARHPIASGVAYTSMEKIDSAEKAADFIKEWKVTTFGTAASDVTREDVDEANQTAKQYRELDADEKKLIEAAQKREFKKNQISRELRSIAESSDPVGEISGAIGSTVAMAAVNVLTRGKTLPISWQLYSEANYDQLRLENPSLEPSEARLISRMSAASEAGIDAFGIGLLRTLPSVAAVLKSGTSAAWRNAGARLGATFVFEQAQEGVQDLTMPFTRAVFEAVGIDTGLDMASEWERWKNSRGTVAIASIPLILLGAGIATHRDIKDAQNLLSSRDKLGEQGIIEVKAVPILEAARAGKMDEAQALYREAFKRRSPEVAEEYQAKLETQQKATAEAIVEVTRQGLIPEYTLLPGGKVVVTDLNDGSKATFDSWRDAQPVIEQNMNEMERINNDSILRIADDILQKKDEEVTVSPRSSDSLATRVRGGSMSPEDAIKAAIAANVIQGVNIDEARKIAADVFGESQEERIKIMRDAVERAIILGSNVVEGGMSKSKLFKGANLTTLIEETSEGRLKEGLRLGRYKKSDWLGLIQQAEEATGEKFLIGSTSDAVNASPDFAPRALVEAVSRIVVADVLGRLQDGRRIGSGSITKSLEENNSPLVAWVRAFKRLLASVLQTAKRIREARKTGKLGDEYDAYIDDILGIDSQVSHNAVAEEVGTEIVQKGIDTSGYLPETPGPNGETFSTSRAIPADASKIVQMPDGAQLVGPTTFSIRAYHGTPHKVDKFSLSKIGTGEGAQAYGWGLYFAESRTVGETYRNNLSKPDNSNLDAWKKVAKALREDELLGFNSASEAMAAIRTTSTWRDSFGMSPVTVSLVEQYLGEQGNLYTVELLPDESEFLDWDKPLSEQSEKVKAVFRQWLIANKWGDYLKDIDSYDAGGGSKALRASGRMGAYFGAVGSIYEYIASEHGGEKGLSRALSKAGIPGFKYLDASSRGAGDGTRNYVIFDENLVRILEENGKPVDSETFSLAKWSKDDKLSNGFLGTSSWSSFRDGIENIDPSAKGGVSTRASNAGTKDAELTSLWRSGFTAPPNAKEDARGGEHVIEFRNGRAYKQTHPETFGAKFNPETPNLFVWGTPLEYLQRWRLFNEIFNGADVRFEGVVMHPNGALSLKISQPIINGEYPSVDNIEDSLGKAGWKNISLNTWEKETSRGKLLMTDAKPANFKVSGGVVVPVDVIVSLTAPIETFSIRSGDFASRMEAKFSLFQAKPELRLAIAQVAKERVLQQSVKINEAIAKQDAATRALQEAETAFAEEMASLRADYEADEKAIRDERDTELKGVAADKGTELDSERIRRDADKKLARVRLEYERNQKEIETKKAANDAKLNKSESAADREALKAIVRALDGALAVVPPVVRASVGGYFQAAKITTSAGMLKWAETRIDKLNVELEKYLKKEYRQQIAKLFKRYAPKKDDKGRITSNITADAAEDIGFAFDFASLDDANQEKEMAALEKTLEESEDSTEIQDAIGKLAIVQLFHKLEERESSELEAAAMWLKEVGGGARETRKIIDAARAEWVKEAKNEAKTDASNGKLSSLPDAENVEADVRSSTFKRFTNDVKGFLNSALFTLGQQLEIVFGQDSRITTEFHRRAVMAANNSTDIKRDIEAKRAEFVAKLFGTKSRIQQAGRMGALTVPTASGVIIEAGGKTTTIDVPAEIVLKIIEGTADLKALGFTNKEASTLADAWADNEALPAKRQKRVFKIERRSDGKNTELTMSQDEAIQYLLWSKQKASREQMERDGWSKESFRQLNTFLSDDAKALAGFFADEYARMGRLIEPVYRRMFYAPFPQVTNYSPIFRDISSADSIIDIDQQGHGSGVSSGFILARNKNARSAMRRTSAISAFMQHAESAAHWVSHVELVRDLRSVLIDKEVQNAIRSNGRTAAANGIKKRVMQLENQGKVGAAGIAELDSWGSRLLQARAFKGLAWRISPVLKQTSAYFNPLLADVPAWDYMRGTARLLSGKLDVSAMWKSPDIQRRIAMGFSAEAKIAMDRLGYTGSTLLAAMGKGMMPMALIDAGWTTVGAAIAFDYYRRNNIKSGMNEAMAENAALDQLEMMIAESAQPADAVNRSLIEGIQNPWLKSMWMFSSESRKTLAIEIMALRRLATGKSKNKAMDAQRAVVAHVVMAATTQLMAGVLSLLMGDDDDREREWSVEEWAAAIAAGPINGLFLFGDAVNYVGRRLFGLHAFEPSTAIGQAVKTVSNAPSNLDKVINGEPEEQRKAFLRLGEAVGQAASLVGPGNPFTATDVILGNPLKDAEKILTRLTD